MKRVLLSHLMNRSQRDLDGLVRTVRERYAGEVLVASDGLRLTP